MYYQNMTNYYRNVLAAQYRGQIDLKKMSYQIISIQDFLNGFLSESVINQLRKKENRKEEIPIIFAVKTLKTEYMEGKKVERDFGELTCIFYVPAQLIKKDDGIELQPALTKEKLPWIPREVLEPLSEEALSFGSSEDSDLYYEETVGQKNKIDTWKDYIKYCKNYFYKVTGTSLEWTEDFKRRIKYENQVYVFIDNRIDTVKQIINLYDNIVTTDASLKLYKKFMEIPKENLNEPIDENDISFMKRHCGQMGGGYPLANSQRRSVNCFNNMEDGEILAVSGPPGTGKTTLLQSIVAGLFVRAALEETEPPVIVATSANNQAVTNIIESFGKIETNESNNLEKRWVSVANSFAVYFPSQNKEKAALEKGYHITSSGSKWEHFARIIDGEENIDVSKENMLKEAKKYFGRDFTDISDCKECIYSSLKKMEKKRVDILSVVENLKDELKDQPLEAVINDIESKRKEQNIKKTFLFYRRKENMEEKELWERYERILLLKKQIETDIFDLCELKCNLNRNKMLELAENGNISQFNEILDKEVRYPEFWLAVHYFECRYLAGDYKTSDKQKETQIDEVYERIYHRLALLTPCMVMTFYSLPNNFKVYNKNRKRSSYLYDFIDLLIVDEAGQVTPEVAAASFALAKKAFIVGDEQQIPPVWNVDKNLDISLAMESSVIDNVDKYQILEESGHECSGSSVMRIAKNSCRFSWKTSKGYMERGVFLSEHRRCYDEIIAYCNGLVYNGDLEALRGKRSEDRKNKMRFPAIGHYNIFSKKSEIERQSGSRRNDWEAKEIVNWLKINYASIVKCYPEVDARQILAIITPFKAQVICLRQYLKDMGEDIGKNIDVGTVHTFQGAERKVIILSTVYGAGEPCYFINQNSALMNVAVSRAKDAFWVFGAYDCLDKEGESASSLLRVFAKEKVE